MNRTWNLIVSPVGLRRTVKSEPRIKSGGSGFEKVKAKLAENDLYILNCYNKWYSVGSNKTGHSGKQFDTLAEVKDWIKNDMSEYLEQII